MDSEGRIRCGPHGRPYCPVCSDDIRRQLGIDDDGSPLREKIETLEAGELKATQRLDAVETDAELSSRVRDALTSLGLGKRGGATR